MTFANKMNTADSGCSSNPLVIVLSGPSGVGKDAILNHMKENKYPFFFMTTVTTRKRRESEVDGVHYHFLSLESFQKLLENQDLLESANVYGNWYGVPKQPIREALAKGLDTIIKVDVQGAASIKKILPEAVFIFINAPSVDELCNRLTKRSTECASDLSLRLQTAQSEVKQMADFDYVIMNYPGEIETAVKDILAIVKAEKCRIARHHIDL